MFQRQFTQLYLSVKRKDMIMKIYVKSAGFSIDQDYSWIDEAGKNITPDASILAYNVSDIQFVWKSTSGSIYFAMRLQIRTGQICITGR